MSALILPLFQRCQRRRESFIIATLASLLLLSGATTLHAGSPQALWLANAVAGQQNPACFLTVNTIAEYLPRELQNRPAPRPQLINRSSALSNPSGLAFDPGGNLWVVSNQGPALLEYSQSQLQSLHAHPAPPPLITITSAGFESPSSLVFDRAGNLWVADLGGASNPALFKFTPAQQAAGGNLAPNLIVTSLSLLAPGGMAMDPAGNLWVGNVDQFLPLNALKFTADQLAAGGQQSPTVTLGLAVAEPINLVFDQFGNLWVNDWSENRLLMFRTASLNNSGSPSPDVVLTATTLSNGENSLASPDALAFDPGGNLWVSNSCPNHNCTGSLAEFTPSQLGSSGSPRPTSYITADAAGTSPVGVTAMVFGPVVK